MKKLLSIMAVVMLIGAVSSWAATNVASKINVTLKGVLSNGAKVTEADLAGTGNLSVLDLEIISGSTTNEENVIAKSVVVSNNVLTSAKILLTEQAGVNLGKGKFADVFASTDVDTNITGGVWFVSGAVKETIKKGATNTTLTGTVQGIWKDTSTAFKGTIGTAK